MALNPLDKVVADIKFSIPKQILKKVFVNKLQSWSINNVSVEDQIKNLVLQPKVLVDCDIVGGSKIYVATSDIPREYTDQFTVIFRIPKDKTQGRSITSVLGIGYLETNSYSQQSNINQMKECSVNVITENAAALFGANNSIPISSTAECSLIAENTVMVKDTMYIKPNGYLWCEISNAQDLSNIQIRSLLHFSHLCKLAVKAYIYNQYIIDLDEGEIYAGHELGAFRSIIEGYSDADEQYHEYLRTTWSAVAWMNDAKAHTDLIRMQIPGRL